MREDEMSERSERCEREWDRVSEEDERSEMSKWTDSVSNPETTTELTTQIRFLRDRVENPRTENRIDFPTLSSPQNLFLCPTLLSYFLITRRERGAREECERMRRVRGREVREREWDSVSEGMRGAREE